MRECANKRLSGEFKTHVESVDCSNPRIIIAFQEAHYPYMDLIQLQTAARLEGAKQIDSGALSEDEFQHEADELAARVKAEIHQRLQAAQSGQAQVTPPHAGAQTAQALLQGLPGLQAR